MQDKLDNLTIALAGLVQSVCLMRDIAQTGKTHESAYQTSINSLFETSPDDAINVFGKKANLKYGLEKLISLFQSSSQTSRQTIRYVLTLMSIQKRIFRSTSLVETLTQRINQAKKQAAYFSITHPTVIANLADIYITIIMPFRFRFYILGNQQILQVQENTEKIRALLLCAIRAALLWRQMGGSRFQLIFLREKIKKTALKLLKDLEHDVTEPALCEQE